MRDTIEHTFEHERPVLDETRKNAVWENIEAKLQMPAPSPYTQFMNVKSLAVSVAALIFVVGTTGTVAAADAAKPGDTLFPLDQAVERTRLALSLRDEKKAALQSEYARERLEELRSIITEETAGQDNRDVSSSTETVLVDDEGEARIGVAAQIVLDYLEVLGADDVRTALLTELSTELGALGRRGDSSDVSGAQHIQIRDNRIEIREDGVRIKVERDGTVRVKSDDDSNGDQFEAEADVFADVTIVTVELRGRKSVFETSADSREEVIGEILARYDVDRATVMATLDFEIEDRGSWSDDSFEDEYEDEGDDDAEDRGRHRNDDFDEWSGIKRFEVKIEDGEAEVRIEYGNDKKLEFKTNATSEAAILVDVSNKTGLSIPELSAAIDLEIED